MKANSIELENRLKKLLAPGRAEVGKRLPEFIALALYAGLYILITVYHEPWFDEAQSWQIGRYCSLREMLFVAPKYEGHPSFWWLLLAIPSKLGVPYELGLKGVGLLLSTAVAGMILFRSPFPRPVRLLLPFTYFLFYQYGVIVRPYTVMALAMLLAADRFEEKDRKPLPFVLSLGLLCLSSAYGIVLAGGLCIAWVWDLIREKGFGGLLREVFRDKRTRCLLGLLLLALLLIWQILPAEDMYNPTQDVEPHPLRNFLVLFFTIPADVLVTTSPWFSGDNFLLQQQKPELTFVLAVSLLSLLLVGLFALSFPRKRLKYAWIPYLLFTGFGGMVYIQTHHIGTVFVFLVMIAWTNLTAAEPFALGKAFVMKFAAGDKDIQILKRMAGLTFAVCLGAGLFWSGAASLNDIRYSYDYSREMAGFLKTYGFDEKICVLAQGDENETQDEEQFFREENSRRIGGSSIDAYFDQNIFVNLHGGDDIGYSMYVQNDVSINKENYAKTNQRGVPDVLLGAGNVRAMSAGRAQMEDYAPVLEVEMHRIWKSRRSDAVMYIYLKKTLQDAYGLQTVEVPERLEDKELHIDIPEELKERARRGEDITPELESLFDAAMQ